MEFKGTKGEWRVNHDTTYIQCGNEIVSLTGFLRRYDDTRLDGESWLSMRERTLKDRQDIDNEIKANAKLIAAAPELLKALIEIKEILQKSWPNQEWEEFADIETSFNKAINKALK